MKKYLISENGNFYKANLHCHSIHSDGKLTPQELKEIYTKKGYSIIAFTDHDVFLSHSYLDDENFLALHGFEMEVDEEKDSDFCFKKTCHMCLIALDPLNMTQVCYHREKYLFANAPKYRDQIIFDPNLADYERKYGGEGVSDMMRIGRENGFFVTYNHPGWSLETLNEYGNYNFMHAMEIGNYGCILAGYTDYNEKEYDQMLSLGKRIYCIATDDNHNHHPKDSVHFDSFGCWTMIKAPKLEYKAITDALVNGNFYASQGPEIYELVFEDGKIKVKCSEACKIVLNTGRRRTAVKIAEDGVLLNSAEFDVFKEDNFVRITVLDKFGKPANTNAYFTDELFGGM